MVSQYNISDPDKKYGVKNLGLVVGKVSTVGVHISSFKRDTERRDKSLESVLH